MMIGPKPVEDDAELDRCAQALEEISIESRDREMTPEELAMSSLLTMLISEYDDRVHPLPDVEPVEMVKFLMEQHQLRHVDVRPVFGSHRVASDILSGKRELSTAHVRKLAKYFKAPAGVFVCNRPAGEGPEVLV
jgi:HTH-type transcriptional regulator/antitoxin HigA